MAKYTTELKTLIDSGFKLSLFDYEIFDENYREILNDKIINHYAFYEIGYDMPAKFDFQLKNKMNEIMTYYNQLYKSELLSFNPLYNNETERSYENTMESDNINIGNSVSSGLTKTENNSSSQQNILNVESATPTSIITSENLMGDLYAKNANRQKDSSENISNQNSNLTSETKAEQLYNTKSKNTYFEKLLGVNGVSKSDLLLQFRNTFLNIDMMIINDLSELFMGIY